MKSYPSDAVIKRSISGQVNSAFMKSCMKRYGWSKKVAREIATDYIFDGNNETPFEYYHRVGAKVVGITGMESK